jgi:hypothetical protein
MCSYSTEVYDMKVGDLVQYISPKKQPSGRYGVETSSPGTVIEFPAATHAKEFQKVRVLTADGIVDWIMQFCEVINESR